VRTAYEKIKRQRERVKQKAARSNGACAGSSFRKPVFNHRYRKLWRWLLERMTAEGGHGRVTTLAILRAFDRAVGYSDNQLAEVTSINPVTIGHRIHAIQEKGLVARDRDGGWTRTSKLVRLLNVLREMRVIL
jgi:DNA-binding transcriptional ArsR family regulator